jgi:hypothetical protein
LLIRIKQRFSRFINDDSLQKIRQQILGGENDNRKSQQVVAINLLGYESMLSHGIGRSMWNLREILFRAT